MADHLITVNRRFTGDVRSTEHTVLNDAELEAFNALTTDAERYEFLIDHELTVEDQYIKHELVVHDFNYEVA
jgi:hypothetical protein